MKVKHILRVFIYSTSDPHSTGPNLNRTLECSTYLSLGNLLHKKPITEQIQYLDGIKALSLLFAAMPLELSIYAVHRMVLSKSATIFL